jgi:hypothetical protein
MQLLQLVPDLLVPDFGSLARVPLSNADNISIPRSVCLAGDCGPGLAFII